VVALVLVIYFLAIFEGVLRKWLLPQFAQYLFFIRDPFVLCAYAIASLNRLWPRHSLALKIGLCTTAFGTAVAFLQSVMHGFDGTALLLTVYGWRNYFLYLPLAFLIGSTFTRRDIDRVWQLTALLAIPIAVLVFMQFRSPPDAPINVGNAVNGIVQFQGLGQDETHTRPMGTFTSSTGQTMFLGSAFAMLLALIVTPARRKSRHLLILLGMAGVLSAVAFSGSRYTMLHCALAMAGALVIGLITRVPAVRLRAIALPILLTLAVVVLYPILFPAGFSALVHRWTAASSFESQQGGGLAGRALSGLTAFVPLLTDTPALGYGLGFGGNASTTLGATINGVSALQLAESDWSRHIIDFGPVFGLLIILLRIGMFFWLLRMVWRYTRASGEALALLLFAFVGNELLYGQITGHGTVNVYGWIFMGLCLAAMKRRKPTSVERRITRSETAYRMNLIRTQPSTK
jgi:hypothetical protein